jgi:hypothetical protein
MGRVSIQRSIQRSFRRSLRRGTAVPTRALALASALVLALGPAGCAVGLGGGDNSFASQRGTFVDSLVEGLEFNAGGLIGTTDSTGQFFYDPGTPVTFFVGGIAVGTGPGQAVMTPVTLVPGAVDETNGTVINIVRFLMSIDDDRDPDNGIQISDAVREVARGLTVDFTFPPSTFAGNNGAALGALSAATSAGGTTVSELAAQDHLRKSLLGLLAGSYTGNYVGDDTGTWEMSVDPEGNVTASTKSSTTDDAFDLTGSVHSSGESLSLSATGGPKFEGKIGNDGAISGDWFRIRAGASIGDPDITQTGTFTGGRVE